MKSFWRIIAGLLIFGILGVFILSQKKGPVTQEAKPEAGSEQVTVDRPAEVLASQQIQLKKTPVQKSPSDPKITLTAGNFEDFVSRCFQGESCELEEEDPWKLYQDFKRSGNRRANDSLISYLRKMLTDLKLRDRYKGPLKRMIEDFYPPKEKLFQQAAYYNYLGDLKKSLNLYLELEKRSAGDSSLRPAPKLNIANTLYDLGRFEDALGYYKAALNEYAAGQQPTSFPSSNEMIRHIRDRISEIESKPRPVDAIPE
jgi:tetratricopeptide (TPR) repeat protein